MTRVPSSRLLALAACLAALSGCAVIDLMKPKPADGQPAPMTGPAPEYEPDQPAAAQQASLPTPARPLTPKVLVGLTPEEAKLLLGKPSVEQSDPPATVWTWRHGTCEVDVFFYLDLGTQTFRALTYEFRGAKRREASCLGELKDETDRGRRAQN